MKDVTYTQQQLADLVPRPHADCHKYSRGIVHVVGGSATYPGAAVLAACAAQRMGAGYTQVWCAPESVHDVRAGRPSLVVRPWICESLVNALNNDRNKPVGVLIGPGFGTDEAEESELLAKAMRCCLPTVVDGGALGLLANLYLDKPEKTRYSEQCDHPAQSGLHNNPDGETGCLEQQDRRSPLILTPHAGEAAKLARAAGLEAAAQQKAAAQHEATTQRKAATLQEAAAQHETTARQCIVAQQETAAQIAQAYHAVVVLKGPNTVVSDGTRQYTMTVGGPELAKAGTGDVLAGMICALLAQGLAPFDAAALGSYLHATAGSLAAKSLTDVSVIPEDVVANIPAAIAHTLRA